MNSGPLLKLGSTGADVRRLQRIFTMMKLMGHADIDGTFGPVTRQRVVDFQSAASLAVDGKVGPETWGALPADPDTPRLANGSVGPQVKALQGALRAFRGPGPPTDPGLVDGIFGDLTEAAVTAYQGDRGITADGIVGDHTWWVPAGGAGATLASLAGLTTV
jgi:peptidoglycan hydrolase-like protein with peptidoglycan-binding domain